MIAFLEGVLVDLESNCLVLDVHGVGYEVVMNTANCGFQLGQLCKVYTETVYREDSQQLFGFKIPEQRNFFRLLINKVNGVGPKLAMTILSCFTMPQLYQLIISEDASRLSQCQGVGVKTAQRLILDLKDYLKKQSLDKSFAAIDATKSRSYNDVVAALVGLGYSKKQAEALFEEILPQLDENDSTAIVLKKILAKNNKK